MDEPYQVTLEVMNEGCKGLKFLRDRGIEEYSLADIRSRTEGQTRHLIKVPISKLDEIKRNKFTRVLHGGEVWFDSDGCDVCNTILSNNALLVSGRHISNYVILYDFVVPNHEAFRKIVSTLEDKGLKLKILKLVKFKPKMKILTEKQERTLWLALKLGFFEYPRKIDSIELSKKLGIAPSTLSELERRGIRKILEHYFQEQP
jgi:predicted DNA binding protein